MMTGMASESLGPEARERSPCRPSEFDDTKRDYKLLVELFHSFPTSDDRHRVPFAAETG